MLAQQLRALAPYIARYEQQIAQLFDAHPDNPLFNNLPGAGARTGSPLTDGLRHRPGAFPKLTGSRNLFRDRSGQRTKWPIQKIHSLSLSPVRNSCASLSTSLPATPSASVIGPRTFINTSGPAAKAITPPCAPWPTNGSGSYSAAGKPANPTTLSSTSSP
jgi:hypothetical protein